MEFQTKDRNILRKPQTSDSMRKKNIARSLNWKVSENNGCENEAWRLVFFGLIYFFNSKLTQNSSQF